MSKYTYNPVNNTISLDHGDLEVFGYDPDSNMPVTTELFLRPDKDDVITSLKEQYPQFTDEFRSLVARAWPEYTIYRDNHASNPEMDRIYRKVIAIQLAAFINTKWEIGALK